jgi:hypothetical protein
VDDVPSWLSRLKTKQTTAEHLQAQKKLVEAVSIFQDIAQQIGALKRVNALKSSSLSPRYRKLCFLNHYQQVLTYLAYLQNPPIGGLKFIYHEQLIDNARDHLDLAKPCIRLVYASDTDLFGVWQHENAERIQIFLTYCKIGRHRGPEFGVPERMVKHGWTMLRTAHLAEPDNEDVIREMARWGDFMKDRTSSSHSEG